MENKRFLTAQDVMEMLDVSLSYAYKLIPVSYTHLTLPTIYSV